MIDTEELRRLLAEATPGEWPEAIPFEHPNYATGEWEGANDEDWFIPDIGCHDTHKNDAALIIALHNAAPELLDRLEKAEAMVKKLNICESVLDTEMENPIYFNGGCFNPTYYKIVSRDSGKEIATINF